MKVYDAVSLYFKLFLHILAANYQKTVIHVLCVTYVKALCEPHFLVFYPLIIKKLS